MIEENTTYPKYLQERLVRRLSKLAEPKSPDRAALATLRNSLRPDRNLEALRIVLPYLKDPTPRKEDDAILLAGLFALHPVAGPLSLPKALRKIMADTNSDSIEKRFQALLSSGRPELPTHLRHAVSLVAPYGYALDWSDLYRAIRGWEAESDFARRRWARDFWGSEGEAKPTQTPAETH